MGKTKTRSNTKTRNGKKKGGIDSVVGGFVSKTLIHCQREFLQFGTAKKSQLYRCKSKGYNDLNARLDKGVSTTRVSFFYDNIPLGHIRRKDPDMPSEDDNHSELDELNYNESTRSAETQGMLIAIVGTNEAQYSPGNYRKASGDLGTAITESVKERFERCGIPY